MTDPKTIFESIWNTDQWYCVEEKWTDEIKKLKFVTDDASYSIMVYHNEANFGWIVVLSDDVRNDAGKRIYGVLEDSEKFDTYQDAREYVVQLTEQYP